MVKRIKPPTEAQYARAERSEALSYCPSIVPCKKCGWPVVVGYCCNYCGTADPHSTWEDDVDEPHE